MMKEEVHITNSFEETKELGEGFILQSRILHRGTKGSIIIALYGDLGSGKTTFAQGLAKGLGIEKRLISPTFIIVRQYQLKCPIYSSSEHQRVEKFSKFSSLRQLADRTINFYHIDLYRVQSKRDIGGLGIEEIINDSQNIVVIEWAEKMGNLLPKSRIDIKFEYLNENKREISILKSNIKKQKSKKDQN